MRRLGVVGFDAFHFQRFHCGRLARDFLFQAFEQFALLDDDGVHLFDLMFEMRGVRFELAQACGNFIVHIFCPGGGFYASRFFQT